MAEDSSQEASGTNPSEADSLETVIALAESWRLLVLGPLLIGAAAIGISYFVAPTYTARTSFLPPQQQGSGIASTAIASLGALANLAGGGGMRTPADQYVTVLQSATVKDRIIDRFKLIKVYDVDYRADARRELDDNLRVTLTKRDGVITLEVDDHSPQQAAEIAAAFVVELGRVTSTLAITEAQQRRVFFDRMLAQTRDQLAAAQRNLQGSGFNAGALKAEPKAAAELFARLKAESTAAEVRLQTLRGALADAAPEVVQQLATLSALRAQLTRAEEASDAAGGPDYIGKYREYKYQEMLFELFARQYELARVDEAREGGLIQVIDAAQPPERKSRPRRAVVAIASTLVGAVLLASWVLARRRWNSLSGAPAGIRLRRALLGP